MLHKFLGLIFSMILFQSAWSQDVSISGCVKDEGGMPLSGAHVSMIENGLIEVTDHRGNFSFKDIADRIYTLNVSYVGYEKQEKAIDVSKGSAHVKFTLIEASYMADEAVVTATGNIVARKDISPAISIVSRETLEESKESALLPVLSEQVPGLFVTERGITGFGVAGGAAGHISIRGVGGNPNTGVLVLIDGSPQYMGIFGHPLPDSYVTTDAEKVEVIRGPASMMYGSNAMAGVINIVTREQREEGLGGRARLSYGSYNTWKVSANAGFKHEGIEVFTSVNHDHTDGHRESSSFDITNAYIKVGSSLGQNLKITIDGSIAVFNSVDPGPVGTTDSSYMMEEHWVDIQRNMISMALENTFATAEGAIKLFYNSGRHKLYDGFLSNDFNYGLSIYESINLFRNNTLSGGFDFKSYGGKAENENAMMGNGLVFTDTSLYELGGYVMMRQEFAKKWIFTLGLRLNYQKITGEEWVPQFGLNYLINNNNVVKVSASKGFRYPTIRELYMWQMANPQLRPERMWCYEGSYLGNIPSARLKYEFTVYYQEGDNLIQSIGQYPNIQYENTGQFTHYGIEASGSWSAFDFLNLETNYSWLHMEEPLTAAPEHQWFTSVKYHQSNFEAKIGGMYVHGLYTRTTPEFIEHYFLLNARVSYRLFDYLSLWISGENLLNTDYEINYNYPMPGITMIGGVDVNFKTKNK